MIDIKKRGIPSRLSVRTRMIRKATALGIMTLVTVSCQQEAQRLQPTPPTQTLAISFAGVWETQYSVASCSGGPSCPAPGTVANLTLRLDEIGDGISGFIVVQRGQSPVSGRRYNGTMSLQGRTVPGDSDETVLEVRDMVLSLRSPSDLVGSFELRSTDPLAFMAVRGEILQTTSHSSLPAISDYSGTWRGGYIVRKCVRNSPNPCGGRDSEGLFETLEWVVDGSRNAITLGTLPPLTLSGSLDSAGTELRSEETIIGPERLTITSMSAARNHVGQLNGKVTYVVRRQGPGQEEDIRTVDLDMVNVVQVR